MSDLKERLQDGVIWMDDPDYPTTKTVCNWIATEELLDEAAAEITRLERELAEAKELNDRMARIMCESCRLEYARQSTKEVKDDK